MDFWKAWDFFVEAYQDQENVEIPTLLSFYNFKNKIVLDSGAAKGRLAIRLSKICSKIYTLDKKKELVDELKDNLKSLNLEEEITPIQGDCTSLEFEENFFDAVYSTWVIQSLKDKESAIRELVRVTKDGGAVIIVLTNGEGDETTLREFIDKDAQERREKRIKNTKEILLEDCKVMEKRKTLQFKFPKDLDKTYEILKAITLGNREISEEKRKRIIEFLDKLIIEDKIVFNQGVSFICGYKK